MADTRILQLTDLHLFCDEQRTLKGIPTRQTLRSVVRFVMQSEPHFDHVIVTGDHTHDELPESYQAARDILQPWMDRLVIVPGNHDDRAVMRSVFEDVVERQLAGEGPADNRITFSLTCGSWLCLGLDTHAPGEVPGRMGQEQAQWLRRRLEDHQGGPALLFCHHPPVDVGSQWMDPIGLQDRHLLHGILEEFPSVQLVCCGHVHHEFEGAVWQTRVVTTPSTGIQFDPDGSEPKFASDPPGFRVIEITANEMQTHVIRLPDVEYVPVAGP